MSSPEGLKTGREILPELQASLENYDFAEEPADSCEGFKRISIDPTPRQIVVMPLYDGSAVVYTSLGYGYGTGYIASHRLLIPLSGDDVRYHREILKIVKGDNGALPDPVELRGEQVYEHEEASSELEFVNSAVTKAVTNGGLRAADSRRLSFEHGFSPHYF